MPPHPPPPLLTLPPTDRQIPTILSYVDGEEYYGQQAKNFLVRNPKNTVAYFRDFLGKEYDTPHPYRSACCRP